MSYNLFPYLSSLRCLIFSPQLITPKIAFRRKTLRFKLFLTYKQFYNLSHFATKIWIEIWYAMNGIKTIVD